MSIYYVIYLLLQCRSSIYCIIYQRHEQSCTTPCLQVWGCKHLTTLAVVMCKLFHGSLKASCHHRQRWWDEHSNCRHHNSQVFRVDKVCATHVCVPQSHTKLCSRHKTWMLSCLRHGTKLVLGQTWGLGALGGRNSWKSQKNTKMSNLAVWEGKIQDLAKFGVWEPWEAWKLDIWPLWPVLGGGGGGGWY
jgi:hypothetical protein